MRRAHEAGPDFDREAAAGRLARRRVVVIAEPDTGDEMAGVADEPGIAEILTGSGLAGSHPAGNLRLSRGARDQRLLHHDIHQRDIARLDDLPKLVGWPRVQELAVERLDPGDDVRRDTEPAI